MTKKQSDRMKFWSVVLGLLLVIGLTAGGAYLLNEQGLIGSGGPEVGEVREGPPAGFEEGASMPERPEGGADAAGFSSRALLELGGIVLHIAAVTLVVVGGQWLYTRLRRGRLGLRCFQRAMPAAYD